MTTLPERLQGYPIRRAVMLQAERNRHSEVFCRGRQPVKKSPKAHITFLEWEFGWDGYGDRLPRRGVALEQPVAIRLYAVALEGFRLGFRFSRQTPISAS